MRRAHGRGRAGLTLLELLLALALTATLAGAIGYAFVASVDHQRLHSERVASQGSVTQAESELMRLIQGAKLTDDTSDATTYFIGEADAYGDTGELGCDRLTFTTTADAIPSPAVFSQDDFETQNRQRGTAGGVAEVSLDTQAVGDAQGRKGLFIRTQRPADGDPTQGGTETVLSPDIARMGFRFWDGLEWVDIWNSQTGDRRLPEAVEISYVLSGAPEDEVHTLIVQVPASDVDADNPVSGGSQ